MLFQRYPYRAILAATFDAALEKIPQMIPACPNIHFTFINNSALEVWEEQWIPHLPPDKEWAKWDWRATMNARRPKRHRRFDVAIWSGLHLCGLAFGAPSLRRQNLTIRALQGSPIAGHPLKGKMLDIIHELAAMYGTALGCQELRFSKPLPGMIPRYEALGFVLAQPSKNVIFCGRQLSWAGEPS